MNEACALIGCLMVSHVVKAKFKCSLYGIQFPKEKKEHLWLKCNCDTKHFILGVQRRLFVGDIVHIRDKTLLLTQIYKINV